MDKVKSMTFSSVYVSNGEDSQTKFNLQQGKENVTGEFKVNNKKINGVLKKNGKTRKIKNLKMNKQGIHTLRSMLKKLVM
jgi:ribosomal protein L21